MTNLPQPGGLLHALSSLVRPLLILLLCFLAAEKADADEDVVDYIAQIFPDGIYEKKAMPLPKEKEAYGIVRATKYIPARDGITFGHVIFLMPHGAPGSIEVVLKKLHPPFKTPDGKIETESIQRLEVTLEEGNFGIVANMWNFLDGYEYEFVPGEWRFETIVNGVSVQSSVFDVELHENPARFPICVEGKWGLMNRLGKVLVEPSFEVIGTPGNGLAPFARDGKWGFVNQAGDIVIPPKYPLKMFWHFSEGLAEANINGKYGYIDTKGTLVIPPQFEDANPFFDGLANVKIAGKWGYIDRTGTVVIQPQFLHSSNFFQGLADITINKKSGYIDRQGNFVLPPQFERAGVFSNGLAPVLIDSRHGFIDMKGTVRIPPKYREEKGFSEGLAGVKQDDEKWGFIDRNGSWKIAAKFEDVSQFSGGLAAVRKDKKWGYIDQTGKWVLPPTLTVADTFSDGLAMVAFSPGDWGYVDPTGRLVWGAKRDPGSPKETQLAYYEYDQKLSSWFNEILKARETGDTLAEIRTLSLLIDEFNKTLGPDDPRTLSLKNDLGRAYIEAERYVEASAHLQKVVESFEKRKGADDFEYALALSLLAASYDRQRQFEKALPAHQRGLELSQSKFGPDHANTATFLEGLGVHYGLASNPGEGVSHLERALKIRQKDAPSGTSVMTMTSLGSLYFQMKLHEKAEKTTQQALEMAEAVCGKDHVLTSRARKQLQLIQAEMK